LTRLISNDPKIKYYVHFPNPVFKLHCFVEGGEVVSNRWKEIMIVGGRATSKREKPNTNFAVLYKDSKITPRSINEFLTKNKEKLQKVLVQRWEDFLLDKPTNSLDGNSIFSTNEEYNLGNVRHLVSGLNENYVDQLPIFLEKINKIYPGVINPDTLIHFPAIEWGSERVKVKGNSMEVQEVENLYVVGDVGITQGIVSAAISGTIAGKDIVRKL